MEIHSLPSYCRDGREKRDLTQAEAARLLEISQGYLSKIESDKDPAEPDEHLFGRMIRIYRWDHEAALDYFKLYRTAEPSNDDEKKLLSFWRSRDINGLTDMVSKMVKDSMTKPYENSAHPTMQ